MQPRPDLNIRLCYPYLTGTMAVLGKMGNDTSYGTYDITDKNSHQELAAKKENILSHATRFVLYVILLSHLFMPWNHRHVLPYMATSSLNEK